jgi:hypothetical protein
MYRFFTVLSERSDDEPISQEEIDYASGKKVLDPKAEPKANAYLNRLEKSSENIQAAFQKQADAAAVTFLLS